jgi:S1-C subfamily serine protease
VNWVDLLILVAIGLGIYTGYRRGVVLQLFSWGGFVLGIFTAGFATPPLVGLVDPGSKTAKAFIGLAVFLAIAFTIEGLIAFAGFRVAKKITHERVRSADAIAGAIVAAGLSLLIAWFLSLPAKNIPELSKPVKRSAILRATYSVLHRPPDFLAAIGSLLSRTGFPEVFATFNPSLAPGVEKPPARLARDPDIRFAARRTYKIESIGCEGRVDGSGFPVDGDTVITAAHVVAGTHDTVVIRATDAGGDRFPATVVYMDTNTDIAVLYVPTMRGGSLSVDGEPAPRGTDGAAIGYPGGGPRTTSVARVRMRTDAIGRDIYSRREAERTIYVLRAEVHQGNSGGPFVDTAGRVRGMIFAASASDPEESYALAENEITSAVQRAGDRTNGVDTRDCAI